LEVCPASLDFRKPFIEQFPEEDCVLPLFVCYAIPNMLHETMAGTSMSGMRICFIWNVLLEKSG
jgi:hypothetical protein